MSTTTKLITVDEYEAMVDSGEITPSDRLVLIEGRLVKKMTKFPPHTTATILCYHALQDLLLPGWHARKEDPVRIHGRNSEPEPDVAVARGDDKTYARRHPNETEIAMLVEVADSSLADDRALAATYGATGIPVYWIVNIPDRQLEVYSSPTGPRQDGGEGGYLIIQVLLETESVDLIIAGRILGRIAVADLLPPP
jgi:Uma2 family endonuclease